MVSLQYFPNQFYLFSASWRLLTASGCGLAVGATLTRSKVRFRDGDCARVALAETLNDLAARGFITAGGTPLLAGCPVPGLYVHAAPD